MDAPERIGRIKCVLPLKAALRASDPRMFRVPPNFPRGEFTTKRHSLDIGCCQIPHGTRASTSLSEPNSAEEPLFRRDVLRIPETWPGQWVSLRIESDSRPSIGKTEPMNAFEPQNTRSPKVKKGFRAFRGQGFSASRRDRQRIPQNLQAAPRGQSFCLRSEHTAPV